MIHGARKKFPLIIFLLFTVLNITIWLWRGYFEYKPYASEQELYVAPSAGKSWQTFLTGFSSTDQQAASQFLDSLLRGRDTAALAQIHFIGSFLYKQFGERLGTPSQNDQWRSPWDIYTYFKSTSAPKLWCGHLAILFNYFCLTRGIETRMIELFKPGDHHVVNECYLPAYRKWVLVDITYNQLLVIPDNQVPLNLVEFRHMTGKPGTLQVMASDSSRRLHPDTGYYKNYYSLAYPAYYYHSANKGKIYRTSEKIKRYLFPVSWYKILSDDKGSNYLFYFKQGMLLAWLISLVFSGKALLRKRVKVKN